MSDIRWAEDEYYEPAADMVGPVVTKPGPDCGHPLRLCMVTSRDVCPHALSDVMGRTGYHVTRCLRGAEPMTQDGVATVLGVCRERAREIETIALSKLGRKRVVRELAHEA